VSRIKASVVKGVAPSKFLRLTYQKDLRYPPYRADIKWGQGGRHE
jgi:hypothetical protein